MARPVVRPMSRQEVMSTIVECAKQLGHTPSLAELTKINHVPHRQIVRHFGTYTRALRACNLERQGGGGNKLPLEALFRDWATVVRQMKKIPSKSEFQLLAKHSDTPLKTRFGSWGVVPRYLKRYVEEQGWTEEWKDVLEIIEAHERRGDWVDWNPTPGCAPTNPGVMVDRPLYGPLMRPYPLIHGPMNESGVIYLFGTLSEKMGFVVTRIQTEFPDCEAMRLVEEDRWQRVRIEFEYESRNFLKHMHKASECDLIVCWRHNWPECPLEVVELRGEVGRDRTETP
jgi:Homing endonuclease associated repeat